MLIKKIHRWLGLSLALFWLLQAATGAALVFRWELDDALLPGESAALDTAALAARIASIERGGGKVSSFWASGGAANRFELFYNDTSGAEHAVRLNGASRILRDRRDDARLAEGAVFGTLTQIHHTVLAGEWGEWLVRISGLVLLTHLLLALPLAWPAAGGWRRALTVPKVAAAPARLYHWHRMLGLWLVIPLLLVVTAGVMVAFKPALQRALNAELATPQLPVPSVQLPDLRQTTATEALAQALQRFPGAELSGFSMPAASTPWFTVWVRAPGEGLRKWGATAVFVSAQDGRILLEQDARSAPVKRKFINALYPLHTGQLGGMAGRAGVLLSALLLITLILFGIRLWWVRR